MYAVETLHLHHRYGAAGATLEDIGLQVPAGAIYGFLGPNGAGKTTTLRLLLGLLAIQRGEIRIFGRSLREARIDILRQVGAMIEGPSSYDHLSAAENLALLALVHRVPQRRCADVLEHVGLADTGRKRVGHFSLGMKQRLGIAAALLHRPALLLLDEPSNGLDPNGMIDMRDLLLTLNREHGTTIVVSSHLLAEIERLATHLGVVHRGRLLFQGTPAALRELHGTGNGVILRTDDNRRAGALLGQAGVATRLEDDALMLPALPPVRIAAINRDLVGQGVAVHAIGAVPVALETIFMDLIGVRAG